LATVDATAKSITSGSAENQSRPNVLVMVVTTLLPKFFPKTLVPALGEESDGWHLTRKKANFCD
jgi:hypothetical protein